MISSLKNSKVSVSEFTKGYFEYLNSILNSIKTSEIEKFIEILLESREKGSTVFFIGNGGSAATASHFSNDLAIGTRTLDKPFKVMSLTDNMAVVTAIGNDFGYTQIFSQQIRAFGKKGDVLVAISASGNSENLIEAIKYAKDLGITTVSLTSFDGGKMKTISDFGIHVPTVPKAYGPAEDAHMILDHVIHGFIAQLLKE